MANPWLEPSPCNAYHGPFRHNVVSLLKQYGTRVQLYGLRKVTAWIVPLYPGTPELAPVLLHVYDEQLIDDKPSICDQCRNMGWQHHPVCNRRYHFIIPAASALADPLQLFAQVEAHYAGQQRSSLHVPVLSVEEKDDTRFNAPASVFDSAQHHLHGVIHANGRGHLLRVGARTDGTAAAATVKPRSAVGPSILQPSTSAASTPETAAGGSRLARRAGAFSAPPASQPAGGSTRRPRAAAQLAADQQEVVSAGAGLTPLSGPQLMTLWDKLCGLLCCFEVSIEDVSNKSDMLLRVLHSAAFGNTWYGKWGYTFGRAPFCIDSTRYHEAVRAIAQLPLSDLQHALLCGGERMARPLQVVTSYSSLSLGITAFSHLLQLLLHLVAQPGAAERLSVDQGAALAGWTQHLVAGVPQIAAGRLLLTQPDGQTGGSPAADVVTAADGGHAAAGGDPVVQPGRIVAGDSAGNVTSDADLSAMAVVTADADSSAMAVVDVGRSPVKAGPAVAVDERTASAEPWSGPSSVLSQPSLSVDAASDLPATAGVDIGHAAVAVEAAGGPSVASADETAELEAAPSFSVIVGSAPVEVAAASGPSLMTNSDADMDTMPCAVASGSGPTEELPAPVRPDVADAAVVMAEQAMLGQLSLTDAVVIVAEAELGRSSVASQPSLSLSPVLDSPAAEQAQPQQSAETAPDSAQADKQRCGAGLPAAVCNFAGRAAGGGTMLEAEAAQSGDGFSSGSPPLSSSGEPAVGTLLLPARLPGGFACTCGCGLLPCQRSVDVALSQCSPDSTACPADAPPRVVGDQTHSGFCHTGGGPHDGGPGAACGEGGVVEADDGGAPVASGTEAAVPAAAAAADGPNSSCSVQHVSLDAQQQEQQQEEQRQQPQQQQKQLQQQPQQQGHVDPADSFRAAGGQGLGTSPCRTTPAADVAANRPCAAAAGSNAAGCAGTPDDEPIANASEGPADRPCQSSPHIGAVAGGSSAARARCDREAGAAAGGDPACAAATGGASDLQVDAACPDQHVTAEHADTVRPASSTDARPAEVQAHSDRVFNGVSDECALVGEAVGLHRHSPVLASSPATVKPTSFSDVRPAEVEAHIGPAALIGPVANGPPDACIVGSDPVGVRPHSPVLASSSPATIKPTSSTDVLSAVVEAHVGPAAHSGSFARGPVDGCAVGGEPDMPMRPHSPVLASSPTSSKPALESSPATGSFDPESSPPPAARPCSPPLASSPTTSRPAHESSPAINGPDPGSSPPAAARPCSAPAEGGPGAVADTGDNHRASAMEVDTCGGPSSSPAAVADPSTCQRRTTMELDGGGDPSGSHGAAVAVDVDCSGKLTGTEAQATLVAVAVDDVGGAASEQKGGQDVAVDPVGSSCGKASAKTVSELLALGEAVSGISLPAAVVGKLKALHSLLGPASIGHEPAAGLKVFKVNPAAAPRKASTATTQRGVDAVLRAVRELCVDRWMPCGVVNSLAEQYYRDGAVISFVSNLLANTRVGPWAIYRARYEGYNQCRLELAGPPDVAAGMALPPLEYQVPEKGTASSKPPPVSASLSASPALPLDASVPPLAASSPLEATPGARDAAPAHATTPAGNASTPTAPTSSGVGRFTRGGSSKLVPSTKAKAAQQRSLQGRSKPVPSPPVDAAPPPANGTATTVLCPDARERAADVAAACHAPPGSATEAVPAPPAASSAPNASAAADEGAASIVEHELAASAAPAAKKRGLGAKGRKAGTARAASRSGAATLASPNASELVPVTAASDAPLAPAEEPAASPMAPSPASHAVIASVDKDEPAIDTALPSAAPAAKKRGPKGKVGGKVMGTSSAPSTSGVAATVPCPNDTDPPRAAVRDAPLASMEEPVPTLPVAPSSMPHTAVVSDDGVGPMADPALAASTSPAVGKRGLGGKNRKAGAARCPQEPVSEPPCKRRHAAMPAAAAVTASADLAVADAFVTPALISATEPVQQCEVARSCDAGPSPSREAGSSQTCKARPASTCEAGPSQSHEAPSSQHCEACVSGSKARKQTLVKRARPPGSGQANGPMRVQEEVEDWGPSLKVEAVTGDGAGSAASQPVDAPTPPARRQRVNRELLVLLKPVKAPPQDIKQEAAAVPSVVTRKGKQPPAAKAPAPPAAAVSARSARMARNLDAVWQAAVSSAAAAAAPKPAEPRGKKARTPQNGVKFEASASPAQPSAAPVFSTSQTTGKAEPAEAGTAVMDATAAAAAAAATVANLRTAASPAKAQRGTEQLDEATTRQQQQGPSSLLPPRAATGAQAGAQDPLPASTEAPVVSASAAQAEACLLTCDAQFVQSAGPASTAEPGVTAPQLPLLDDQPDHCTSVAASHRVAEGVGGSARGRAAAAAPLHKTRPVITKLRLRGVGKRAAAQRVLMAEAAGPAAVAEPCTSAPVVDDSNPAAADAAAGAGSAPLKAQSDDTLVKFSADEQPPGACVAEPPPPPHAAQARSWEAAAVEGPRLSDSALHATKPLRLTCGTYNEPADMEALLEAPWLADLGHPHDQAVCPIRATSLSSIPRRVGRSANRRGATPQPSCLIPPIKLRLTRSSLKPPTAPTPSAPASEALPTSAQTPVCPSYPAFGTKASMLAGLSDTPLAAAAQSDIWDCALPTSLPPSFPAVSDAYASHGNAGFASDSDGWQGLRTGRRRRQAAAEATRGWGVCLLNDVKGAVGVGGTESQELLAYTPVGTLFNILQEPCDIGAVAGSSGGRGGSGSSSVLVESLSPSCGYDVVAAAPAMLARRRGGVVRHPASVPGRPLHDVAHQSRCAPHAKGGRRSRLQTVSLADHEPVLRNGGYSVKHAQHTDHASGKDSGSARERVLQDLRSIYDALLSATGSTKQSSLPTAPGTEVLHSLARNVQLVKDTKYIVKDYGGPWVQHVSGAWQPPRRGSGAAVATTASIGPAPAASKALHVSIQVMLDNHSDPPPAQPAKANPAASAGRSAATAVALSHPVPARPAQLPPCEPLLMPLQATVADLKRAAADTLGQVYRMFRGFHVTTVFNLVSEGPVADQALVSQHLPLGGPGAPAWLLVTGVGQDADPKWQHAGGLEDWHVACTCGTVDDDGERMISCDRCNVWMHTRCNGIGDDEGEPPSWVCPNCSQ